jgi:pimeloyl-ACP methyl ester carboxylesterase
MRDETSLCVDTAALASTSVPLMLTRGTESPALFAAVIGEVASLVPTARVEVIEGAGHVPHSTHPDEWVARLTTFHETVASLPAQRS